MNIKTLTFALAVLALGTGTAANAQCNYFNNNVSNSVLTYPAVMESSACDTGYSTSLNCAPLFGKHTYYDEDRFVRRDELLGYSAYDTARINTFSAVVPDAFSTASATRVCGQRLSNSLFDVRLFGFGLGFGKVSPRADMRAAGEAF